MFSFFNSNKIKKPLTSFKKKSHVAEESIFMVTDETDVLMETACDQELGNHSGFCN